MSEHDDGGQRARRRSRLIAAGVGAAVAVLLALTSWWRGSGEEEHALTQLPAAERRELYERTLHTLESTCAPQARPPGLQRYCRQQAEFIVRFPECDQVCRELAGRDLPKPTR
jgi:hypothetical protein